MSILWARSSPLVAIHAKKDGQIPHFRHLPGNDCQHGLESAVHLAVKQLIAEQKKLYLPELIATISVTDAMGQTHSPTSIINQAGTHFFSSVRLECQTACNTFQIRGGNSVQ